MKSLLEYQPQSESEDNLVPLTVTDGDSVFSGSTEFRLQESYAATRGIKKGLQRFQSLGFIPESLQPTGDAFLEVASNNLLPGIGIDDAITAQYIKFRGGTSVTEVDDPLKTDILISQCIFGISGNRLTLEDGSVVPMTSPKSEFANKVVEVDSDDVLSLYEIESIARQSQLIKHLVDNNDVYTSATIGLPRVGYYLHALKPYAAGKLSPEQAIQWFDAVDRRFSIVLDAVRSSIEDTVPTRVVTPLDGIDETLREIVRSGKEMRLGPLLARLALSDDLWKKILQTSAPHDVYQLKGDFADAVDEMRIPSTANTRLVIKSPKEEGTFELKDSISKRAGLNPPVVAMYALPQIVTLEAGKGLYQMERQPTVRDTQLIARQY